MPFRCKDCRKHFSVKVGTVMQDSKLGLQVWLLAVYLLNTGLKGTSSMKLHRDLGVTQKTAWHLAHRIREGMDVDDFLFSGPVEADETYVGGLEGNKHKDKRMKAAGGPVGKAIVAGVKDRATNKVAARVVADTKAPTLTGMIAESADAGAEVFTDEARGYSPLSRMGYRHRAVRHGVAQWVADRAHINGMESFWAMLKRGYHGTYHQMSPEHLGRYVAEFQHRHNERPKDTIRQIASAVKAMEGKMLPYQRLVANGVRARAE